MKVFRHFVLFGLLATSSRVANAQYLFTDLSPPQSAESVADSISSSGIVVGRTGRVAVGTDRPFVWRNGRFFILPLPESGGVPELSPEGVISGTLNASGSYADYAFRLDDTGLTPLGYEGTIFGRIKFALPNGTFAGIRSFNDENHAKTHVYLWSNGITTDITPDALTVPQLRTTHDGNLVGIVRLWSSLNHQPFVWHQGQYQALTPSDPFLRQFLPMSDPLSNDVVGIYRSANVTRSYHWRNGVYTELEPPGAHGCFAVAVNAAIQVVGTYLDAQNASHGFLWDKGNFTDFTAALTEAVGPIRSSEATQIDDDGRVLGKFVENTQGREGMFLWKEGNLQIIKPSQAQTMTADLIRGENFLTGSYVDTTSQHHLFLWQSGTLTELLPPGAQPASEVTLLGSGRFAGAFIAADGTYRGFVWDNGKTAEIFSPGARNIMFLASADWVTASLEDDAGRRHEFISEDGVATEITIPGATSVEIIFDGFGYLGGSYVDADGYAHAFLRVNGETFPLGQPGEVSSRLAALNPAGMAVVVSNRIIDEQRHTLETKAFVWQAGVITDIASIQTREQILISSIDAQGLVAGQIATTPFLWQNGNFVTSAKHGKAAQLIYSSDSTGPRLGYFGDLYTPHAFVLRDGLLVELEPFLPPGVKSSRPSMIGSAGEIVGSYVDAQSITRAFLLTPNGIAPTPTPVPTPEPTATPRFTPAPTATPRSPTPAKILVTARPPKITRSKFVTIRGTTTGRLRYRIGDRQWKIAPAGKNWNIRTSLERGRNVITLVAFGEGGNAKPIRFVVIRR